MRLDKHEIQIIKSNILSLVKDADIMLFGSRVDDTKKGGDIDIFVQTKQKISIKDEIEILSGIEANGIERKVDLVFKTPYKKEQAIFQTALKEGIHL